LIKYSDILKDKNYCISEKVKTYYFNQREWYSKAFLLKYKSIIN
jgi:hypothetical protein